MQLVWRLFWAEANRACTKPACFPAPRERAEPRRRLAPRGCVGAAPRGAGRGDAAVPPLASLVRRQLPGAPATRVSGMQAAPGAPGMETLNTWARRLLRQQRRCLASSVAFRRAQDRCSKHSLPSFPLSAALSVLCPYPSASSPPGLPGAGQLLVGSRIREARRGWGPGGAQASQGTGTVAVTSPLQSSPQADRAPNAGRSLCARRL